MTYDIEDIIASQKIFYYLLENRELREEDEPNLYKAYAENESVIELVKSQAKFAKAIIERYGNIIYLIPDENNNYLGFSKNELKSILCKSQSTDKDYYLSQFVILVLLVEFYDGQGSTSKTREYIKLGELLNSVSERLKEGRDRFDEDEEDRDGVAFANMSEAFEALRSEIGSKKKTTKEGFLYSILNFLENQGLITYHPEEEMILTTQKLDRFMDYNLLNRKNYYRVLRVMGVLQDEQN